MQETTLMRGATIYIKSYNLEMLEHFMDWLIHMYVKSISCANKDFLDYEQISFEYKI